MGKLRPIEIKLNETTFEQTLSKLIKCFATLIYNQPFSYKKIMVCRKHFFCHYSVGPKLTLMGLCNGCWCALIKIAWPANPCQIHHLKLKLFCSGTHSGSTANDPSAIWHAAEQVLLVRAQPTGDAAIILKSWPWMIFYMTFSMYIRRCNPRCTM